jgi:hypothetical protein
LQPERRWRWRWFLLGLTAALGLSLSLPAAAQHIQIERARLVHGDIPVLELTMRADLGPSAEAALDAGLALRFAVDYRAEPGVRLSQPVVLRASPLLRSYTLLVGQEAPQQLSLRNALLVAFENVRVPLAEAPECADSCSARVRIRLDPAALPAPLRLPALVDAAWRLDSGWVEVSP